MEELKPCPFCGRKPEIRHNADGFSYVLCANDGCYARTDGCLNDNEAAKAWNRRAKPGNKPLTLEQLRQMDGSWVWLVDEKIPDYNGWYKVVADSNYFTLRGIDNDYYQSAFTYGIAKAYARKPEGSCSMA